MKQKFIDIIGIIVIIVAIITCVYVYNVFDEALEIIKSQRASEDMQKAYNDVLYRVWIDNPNYVEDVLTESDEYQVLTTLIDDEKIYGFRNIEDSITYETNIDVQETMAEVYIDYLISKNSEPDSLSVSLKPDKPSKPVKDVKLNKF